MQPKSPDGNHGVSDYFPHLPPYSDPTTGLLSKLPRAWIPYAQLMRIDRPGGFYAFYIPYLIGLMYSACVVSPTPRPIDLLSLAGIFIPFNIILRGAACTWNDTVDQDFDRRVARCRHRPVARGAVSTSAAHLFTACQLGVLFPVVALCFPPACAPHMLVIVLLFGVYALMKRVTYYPQVVLGIPFAWAIFFCNAALGGESFPFSISTILVPGSNLVNPHRGTPADATARGKATLSLFCANILWTVTYDTIYAHQDVTDDAQAGVKSMALRFRHNTKALASILTMAQVGLLTLCGMYADFGTLYFLGTVGGVAVAMGYYIYDVDLDSPESCAIWFHDQFWIVGAAFLQGFVCEYARKLCTSTPSP